MPPSGVSLRPITAEDTEVLFQVYASTRAEELAALPWTGAQQEALLRMQFRAQHAHYQARFPDADLLLVLQGGRPVGRLSLQRGADALHLIDIALLPEARGAGLGGALLGEVLEEARAAGKPVRLHVERHNRARRLYQRLGFREGADEGGLYLSMEWTPS